MAPYSRFAMLARGTRQPRELYASTVSRLRIRRAGGLVQTPQGLRMLLGAFRGGNPLGRIVGKSPTENGRTP